MVKVLAIMGSPRSKGNTYQVTRMVEERMKRLGDVEFEYLFLRDADLWMCLGCRVCMEKGEEFCPLKDDRALIEEKMRAADAVIFTSPTYVGNVSGLMKNFIDRFAYVCHRPRFFKKAMVLTTSGGGGAGFMLMSFAIPPGTWGFDVVHKVGVVTHERPEEYSSAERKALEDAMNKKVDTAAKKFYGALRDTRSGPGTFSMAKFLYTKPYYQKREPTSVDYQYWKAHGWLEKDACYYFDPKAGLIKKGLAKLGTKFIGLVAK